VKAHWTALGKAVAWGLMATLAGAVSVSPAAASEPASPPTAASTPPTLTAAALAKAAALETRAIAAAQEASPRGSEETRSFLGSPRGKIALVLLAGGIAWTVYSNSHDRIKSPIR
jgi:hypothetical protein